MPFPVAAAIGAGASLLGNLFNIGQANKTNQQQLAFQREMYGQQRQDSLSDWNMNNEYNSPTQQMMRLKDAGLNPHLVYGNGALTTSQAPAASSTPFASLKAPQVNADSAISAFTSLEANRAQVDNLRENVKSQQAEQALKDAQRLNTLAQIPGTEAQSAVSQGIKEHQIEAAKLQNQKTVADTKATLSNAEQNVLKTSQDIKKSVAEIIAMRINSANQTKQTNSNVALQGEQAKKTNLETWSIDNFDNLKKGREIVKIEEEIKASGLGQEIQKLQIQYEKGLITRNVFEKLISSIIETGVNRFKK